MRVKKERQPRREIIHSQTALNPRLHVGKAVLERERQLLARRRTGLADVIPRNRDRVPARHPHSTELDHVSHQPQRRINRETPLLLSDVLLQNVRLDRARQTLRTHTPTLRRHNIKSQHHRRRRVDRHRRRNRAHVDPRKQRLHIVKRVQRHPLTPNLALATHMIRVKAHQARHVERRRQPRLAMRKQKTKTLVGLLRRPKPRELTHRPQTRPIHRPIHTTRKRKLPRKPNPLKRPHIPRPIQRLHRNTTQRAEQHIPLRRNRKTLPKPTLSIRHRGRCGRHSDSRKVAYPPGRVNCSPNRHDRPQTPAPRYARAGCSWVAVAGRQSIAA